MRKVIQKSLLIFFGLVCAQMFADAQWYSAKCGVADMYDCSMEEFNCLWQVAEKNVRKGGIRTATGVVCLGVGAIMDDGPAGYNILPTGLIIAGSLLTVIGVSTWITGLSRKSELKKNPLFDTYSSSRLQISPSIQNAPTGTTYALGLHASWRF
jgi:hypothetical protein